MTIRKATSDYETWLAKHITLLPADLKRKHQAMAQDVFPFLRATFYRWMQLWKISALGATSRAAWYGALTISMKFTNCPIPSIWCAWPPVRTSLFEKRV
jgi:hypothetical protein